MAKEEYLSGARQIVHELGCASFCDDFDKKASDFAERDQERLLLAFKTSEQGDSFILLLKKKFAPEIKTPPGFEGVVEFLREKQDRSAFCEVYTGAARRFHDNLNKITSSLGIPGGKIKYMDAPKGDPDAADDNYADEMCTTLAFLDTLRRNLRIWGAIRLVVINDLQLTDAQMHDLRMLTGPAGEEVRMDVRGKMLTLPEGLQIIFVKTEGYFMGPWERIMPKGEEYKALAAPVYPCYKKRKVDEV
ncbi:unnamed protein product [Chrysoparadoxa australica]